MIPIQPILFSIPSIIYLVFQQRLGESLGEIITKIGWQGSRPVHYLWSLVVTLIIGALGWIVFRTVPAEIFGDPNINVDAYAGLKLNIVTFLYIWFREAIFVALGEEIFFRGFLGGLLYRRFGFTTGNIFQAMIFLLPHLLLLTVSFNLWPLLVVQLVGGWLLGWLRMISGSILPGWLTHSIINALGALAVIGL